MAGQVSAYILIQTAVNAAQVARDIAGIEGIESADDVSGPYDVIVLTASLPLLSESFKQSLTPGGRLFAVVGEPPVMEAQLITNAGGGAYNSIVLFETCIAPLRNAPLPERFVF